MNETALKNKVLKWLRSLDKSWWYKVCDLFNIGIPDIIGCWKGKFVAIELKVKPNKPTKFQKYVIEKIKQAGGIADVCYNLDEVKALLQE